VLKRLAILFTLCNIIFIVNLKSQIIDTAFIGENYVQYSVINTPSSLYYWWVEDAIIVAGQGTSSIQVNWLDQTGIKKISVQESNAANCFSDSVLAYAWLIEPQLFFYPNSFTPNGDGLNDEFNFVLNRNEITKYNLKIFNRWGINVFETMDPTQGWDGNNNSIAMSSDLYIWVVEISLKKGKGIYEKGTIHLLR